jgi:hypothetical protein
MDLFEALVTVALFFALTPGILLTLPLGNKFAVALAHGVVFLIILYLLNSMDYMEGFRWGGMRPMVYSRGRRR